MDFGGGLFMKGKFRFDFGEVSWRLLSWLQAITNTLSKQFVHTQLKVIANIDIWLQWRNIPTRPIVIEKIPILSAPHQINSCYISRSSLKIDNFMHVNTQRWSKKKRVNLNVVWYAHRRRGIYIKNFSKKHSECERKDAVRPTWLYLPSLFFPSSVSSISKHLIGNLVPFFGSSSKTPNRTKMR